MKFIDNPTKPIYIFSQSNNIYWLIDPKTGLIRPAVTEKLSDFAEYETADFCGAITIKSIKSFLTSFQINKHNGPIPVGSVMYFDKKSKFPRTKLANTTDYTRCIKPAKANFVVINTDEIPNRICMHNARIVEYENCYIAAASEQSWLIERYKLIDPQTHQLYNNIFDILERIGFVSKPIKIITEVADLLAISPDVISLMDKFNNEFSGKKYITDKQLDEIINGKLDSLDLDNLESLDSMFSSPDKDVINTAMRLITNYNITEFPLTIKALLIIHARDLYNTTAYNSNSFKQIIETLELPNFRKIPDFPMCLKQLPKTNKAGKTYVYSTADKDLYLKYTQKRRDVYLNSLKAEVQKIAARYNLNIKPI